MERDFWAEDQAEGARIIDAWIEKVNADHDDVIAIGRDLACCMRNEIERLRRNQK